MQPNARLKTLLYTPGLEILANFLSMVSNLHAFLFLVILHNILCFHMNLDLEHTLLYHDVISMGKGVFEIVDSQKQIKLGLLSTVWIQTCNSQAN